MAKDISSRLLELKREIEKAKLDKAEAEGALKQNLKRLLDEFGLDSLVKAKKEIDSLKKKGEVVKTKLEAHVQKMEEGYVW